MKNKKLLSVFVSILIADAFAQTYIPPGNVSGTWTSPGTPYYIQGEITIPNGETLTIEPGVDVIFMDHYKFNVQGRLLAIGTQQDSIRFTAANIGSGWHGIRFNYTPNTNDSSKINYCSFRYGKANTGGSSSWDRCGGAILIGAFDKVIISDCLFENNMNSGDISAYTGGAAIFTKYASPVITNCTFKNNSGTTDCAIFSNYNSTNNPDAILIITKNLFLNNTAPHGPITCGNNKAIISDNFISGNVTTRAGGGIFTMWTKAIITNNIIINNQCFGGEGEGGGIKCWTNDASIIINNTIAFNRSTLGGGICCNGNSDPVFINNIVWGNTATIGNQVNILDAASDPDFLFCDIQGGKEGFGGSGSGVNYDGDYLNNIDTDPIFRDSSNNDLHLMSTDCGYSFNSPCIDAGDPTYENFLLHCNWGLGLQRSDIGAYGGVVKIVGIEDELNAIPTEFLLTQNYPNPFNSTCAIKYSIPKSSQISLKIFNTLGKEIETLVSEEKPVGNYELNWNASNLPSGVYFYRLQAGSFVQTRKMILLK